MWFCTISFKTFQAEHIRSLLQLVCNKLHRMSTGRFLITAQSTAPPLNTTLIHGHQEKHHDIHLTQKLLRRILQRFFQCKTAPTCAHTSGTSTARKTEVVYVGLSRQPPTSLRQSGSYSSRTQGLFFLIVCPDRPTLFSHVIVQLGSNCGSVLLCRWVTKMW